MPIAFDVGIENGNSGTEALLELLPLRSGRIGGEEKRVPHDGPRYSALFEIDGPHVLVSREWAKAVEAGIFSGKLVKGRRFLEQLIKPRVP